MTFYCTILENQDPKEKCPFSILVLTSGCDTITSKRGFVPKGARPFLLFLNHNKMKNIIVFRKGVTSRLYKFYIGKGAIVNLEIASKPLISFLQYQYNNEPQSISGDIGYLFQKV